MKTTILISLRLLIVLTVITGIAYPLLMTGFSYMLFPEQSQGSLIWKNGRAVGSMLIGQQFTSPKYFHGRASAAGYDPMASGASNFAPASRALVDSVAARRTRFAAENSLPSTDLVPPDMLTASGSGLDPEISPEAAMLQVGRITRARHLDARKESQLDSLVQRFTNTSMFGILGRARVNVLLLNLALDDMSR